MEGWAHLEGAQEEVEEELDVAQGALGVLVCDEGEDHLVDAQQGDQGQRGLGQPVGQGSPAGHRCLCTVGTQAEPRPAPT